MKASKDLGILCNGAILMCAATNAWALEPVHEGANHHASAPATTICRAAGPQSPRDITDGAGDSTDVFALAPQSKEMNLCNLHFHKGAEHKSAVTGNGYDWPALAGAGYTGGYRCIVQPTAAELTPVKVSGAEGGCGGIEPGDTIEVHWVFSTCDVAPGEGLGSCVRMGASCKLRVESQVFLLVNDSNAAKFGSYDYGGAPPSSGKHQPRGLPGSNATPVEYRGSTTNSAYNTTDACSPLEVTWRVRPECAKLDIGSLHAWCANKGNVFKEEEGHAPRPLVTNLKLLSKIK